MDKQKTILLFEKLKKRIKRESSKKTLLGDIIINDDEYALLLMYTKQKINKMKKAENHESKDLLLTLTLVQIGIRTYDGRLWPHIENELGIHLNSNHQQWINQSVLDTLKKYHKIHVNRKDIMNLLMHGFVSDHYSDKFFMFLFEYYRIDLERNLENNSSSMLNALFDVIRRNDNTGRTYYLVQQTAEVVSENIKGSKIRIRKYLKLIDGLLWQTLEPKKTTNRLINSLFNWAESSKEFIIESKAITSNERVGSKYRHKMPYLKHDFKRMTFLLCIPSYPLKTSEVSDYSSFKWIIEINGKNIERSTLLEQTVTGFKTNPVEHILQPLDMFQSINVSFCFDHIKKQYHHIKSENFRFFNQNGTFVDVDLINEDQIYAFCPKNIDIESESILEEVSLGAIKRYYFSLHRGDIISLPNGKYLSIGKELEEGLTKHNLIDHAKGLCDEKIIDIYSKAPGYLLKIALSKIPGSMIIVNNHRYHIDISKAILITRNELSDEYWYMISFEDYGVFVNGIYRVFIDVVNEQKKREFDFMIVQKFRYHFENLPYIYQFQGTITFNKNLQIMPRKRMQSDIVNDTISYNFEIDQQKPFIQFVHSSIRSVIIQIDIPFLRWSYDGIIWDANPMKDIFHTQMPFCIYIDYPVDEVRLVPDFIDIEEDSNESDFALVCKKSKQSNYFLVDMTRFRSLVPICQDSLSIQIEINQSLYPFMNIITRSTLKNSRFAYNIETQNFSGHYDILGDSNYYVQIEYPNKDSVKKIELIDGNFSAEIIAIEGIYIIDLYESNSDDSGFGSESILLNTKHIILYDPYNLKEKTIIIDSIYNRQHNRSLPLRQQYIISEFIKKPNSKEGIYTGLLVTKGKSEYGESANFSVNVELEFYDISDMTNVSIQFLNDDEWFYFLYDNKYKILLQDEDHLVKPPLRYSRFEEIVCSDIDYQYIIRIEERNDEK
jgi:hypothetical protein